MLWKRLVVYAACVAVVYAHGGHTTVNVDEEKKKPIDAALWLHIAMEATAWGVLFPLAMVLGLIRHTLHVPLSIAAVALSLGGYFLGSHHKGRQFSHTVHGTNARVLLVVLLTQAVCGTYLRLHLSWRGEARVRPVVLRIHGILGRAFPLLGWVQAVFGVATMQSWCRGGHLGQCLAHYIMGSAFAAYSVILLIMMKCAVEWLHRTGVSQEYLDSWVILVWGVVNTFTEHHGGPWTHKDLQHTLMGVLWWAGGAVGVWLSRKGQRTIFPSIIIALTGWGMSGHAQALVRPEPYSCRCFLPVSIPYLGMRSWLQAYAELWRSVSSYKIGRPGKALCRRVGWGGSGSMHSSTCTCPCSHRTPFLLVVSGILFMSATDEELHWADAKGIDHITWGLIDFSVALLLFLWMKYVPALTQVC